MPPRTGRRHRLSSQVMAQIDMFDQGTTNAPHPAALISIPHPSNKLRSPSDPDAAAARFASVKLADGDIRGAIRILGSEDSHVTPSQSAFDALLSKHPPTPLDRRPTPSASEPLLQSEVGGRINESCRRCIPSNRVRRPAPTVFVPNTSRTWFKPPGRCCPQLWLISLILYFQGAYPCRLDMYFLAPTCMRLKRKTAACVP